MIQAIPVKDQHIPAIKEKFFQFARLRQSNYSGYLAEPGLAQFHWSRIEKDIRSGKSPFPHCFYRNGELVGYGKVSQSMWHTEHFGIPSYKFHPLYSFTTDLEITRGLIKSAKQLLPKSTGAMLGIRLDAHESMMAYALCESDFIHTGTSVRMIYSVNNHSKVDISTRKKYDNRGIKFRDCGPSDIGTLQEMIKRSHHHSHFFSEYRFPQNLSQELFAKWIKKCVEGLAEKIIVAEENGKVLGFCSLLSNRSLVKYIHKKIGILDFIVVDEETQGRGIGKALLHAAFEWFRTADYIELRTMADNISAIQFYQKNGFFILSSDQYYHYWT